MCMVAETLSMVEQDVQLVPHGSPASCKTHHMYSCVHSFCENFFFLHNIEFGHLSEETFVLLFLFRRNGSFRHLLCNFVFYNSLSVLAWVMFVCSNNLMVNPPSHS